MKQLLIILTLLSANAFGQKTFTGTYFTSKKDIGFESDIFQFKKNGTFRYVFFTCTGTGLGKGKYEITKDDSLKLQFIDCEACSQTKEIEIKEDSSENIEIDLKIKIWEDDSEMVGVNVYFPSIVVGTTSDETGNAKLLLPRFTETKILRIDFIGYNSVDIEVHKEYSKIKGVIRLSSHWIYNHEDTKTFKIISWTNSKLKLRRYPKLNITYDSVNESKADRLIEDRIGERGYKLYKEKL
jgi:hypothetical protein